MIRWEVSDGSYTPTRHFLARPFSLCSVRVASDEHGDNYHSNNTPLVPVSREESYWAPHQPHHPHHLSRNFVHTRPPAPWGLHPAQTTFTPSRPVSHTPKTARVGIAVRTVVIPWSGSHSQDQDETGTPPCGAPCTPPHRGWIGLDYPSPKCGKEQKRLEGVHLCTRTVLELRRRGRGQPRSTVSEPRPRIQNSIQKPEFPYRKSQISLAVRCGFPPKKTLLVSHATAWAAGSTPPTHLYALPLHCVAPRCVAPGPAVGNEFDQIRIEQRCIEVKVTEPRCPRRDRGLRRAPFSTESPPPP